VGGQKKVYQPLERHSFCCPLKGHLNFSWKPEGPSIPLQGRTAEEPGGTMLGSGRKEVTDKMKNRLRP